MGRRSRTRAAADPAPKAPKPAKPAKPAKPRREGAVDRLNPARRFIAGYLGLAALIGLLTLAGIATLGGDFGPILVFLVVCAAAFGAQRWAAAKTAGLELSEEDRLMRLLATGVLVTATVLALVSAVVSLVVG